MKRDDLSDIETGVLVERFTACAVEQDRALLYDQIGRYNRLYDQIEHIRVELQRRPGDQRRLLHPLLRHASAQVRLKAAISLLGLAPEDARQTLQTMVDGKEYPQAAHAMGMLEAVAEGRYVPQ